MPTATIDPSTPTTALLDRLGPDAPPSPISHDEALAYVRGLATSHYENFHVLSSLVPHTLRDDFAAVYAFCRWADDLGDEMGNSAEGRERSLSLLAWWRRELRACFRNAKGVEGGAGSSDDVSKAPTHPVYIALTNTIRRHSALTITPFDRLIQAFELDQTKQHYQTWDELLHYCTLSADPVGRIVLALAGYGETPENAERYAMSDATCTALQLINHWQDVRRDLLERDRVYVPSADTGVTPEMLRDWAARSDDAAARVPYITMMRELVHRTGLLFDKGAALPGTLDKSIRPVVWLFGAGGRGVMKAIQRQGCTTLWNRPTLSGSAKACLLVRAWMMTRLP